MLHACSGWRRCPRRRFASDGAQLVCLGCAGMASLDEAIHPATGVPVVDGVRVRRLGQRLALPVLPRHPVAVMRVRGLVRTGLRTSTRRRYAPLDEVR